MKSVSLWQKRGAFGSPLFVGVLYLLAIPAFAFVYSVIWEDFYLSTSSHDQLWATERRQSEVEIRELIGDTWIPRQVTDRLPFEIQLNPVYRVEYEPQEGGITAHQVFMLKRGHEPPVRQSIRWQFGWIRGSRGVIIRDLPEEFVTSVRHLLQNNGELSNWTELKEIAIISPKSIIAQWHVEEDVLTLIHRYVSGSAGKPLPIEKRFHRFIYVSAVTITTLGYGDMVPLTARARLTVAIEAVFGVVVAGLFINAVATKNKAGRQI